MSLLALLTEKIRKNGPITVAEYMSLCLTHPEFGYYMRRDPLGERGDFITAPEISQIFGELIGLWFAYQWEKLGKPEATLLELGPGRGTLMADMLRATKKISGFHEAIDVRLLEISPALKQKQWHSLAGKHANIEWLDSLEALPKKPLLLIANEFFDALPIRQFVDGQERMIGMDHNTLSFLPPPTTHHPPPTIKETCEPALAMINTIASHIVKYSGAALIIDYGYTEGNKGDSLQAMRRHAYHSVLDNPGEADLTAHVNFATLKTEAEQTGAHLFGPTPQGRFLMKIGAGQRVQKLCASATPEQSASLLSGLERLASPDQMGDMFKVLALTSKEITHAEGF